MNEHVIVEFLCKQMGFKSADECNYKRPYYQLSGGKIILFTTKSDPGFYFFPFSDIRHAFMVEDAIAQMGASVHNKYATDIAYQTDENFTFAFDNMMDVIHASPKQRCIAAARALATDAQLVEFEL